MKKIVLFLSILFCGSRLLAAPGDTTWVQANNTNLSYYNSYDTTISFPSGSTTYRKIYMIFTLGKYTCPGYTYGTGSVPWCGDWDYTVQNYLMTPGGDTLELGRLITPYANNLAPRTPYTWTQRYIYDVTDYASKLRGSATTRIFFSGYSGGFTANIKFAFIEGTPERNVLDIKRLWHGSFNYGDTSHSDSFNINTHFQPWSNVAPTGTQTAVLKFTATGHGSDSNYCSEFCSTNYAVQLNGSSIATKTIFRDNCGSNQLYPQSGTWLYNRANWCPGASVYSDNVVLPGVGSGTSFNTSLLFDNYVRRGGGPSYTTEATLIYYGPMNHTLDASIEDVIRPTNDENHFRENPVCGNPTLHIRNTGSTTITSLQFNYGVTGYTMDNFSWTGSLPALGETDIVLPSIASLGTVAGTTGIYQFSAKITQVNGVTDEDTTNNVINSSFAASPSWPTSIKFVMSTNNERRSPSSAISETSWVLYDMNDNIIQQRTNNTISTLYTDTLNLAPGCYKLVLYDSGCNGLRWWANPSGTSAGYFNAKKLNGTALIMNGYSYGGGYPNDFGCGFTQYFRTDYPTGITELNETVAALNTYPNPAQGTINVDVDGISSVEGTILVTDMMGRTVKQYTLTTNHLAIPTDGLSNSVYTVQYFPKNKAEQTLTARIVIAH